MGGERTRGLDGGRGLCGHGVSQLCKQRIRLVQQRLHLTPDPFRGNGVSGTRVVLFNES